jgi:putative NIF3 family GTP cyclohydrolase 1 type 2
MKVKDVAAAIEQIVPSSLAQDWDNVGLLIGNQQQNVKNILLTIDVTGDVVTEAKRLKTDLIVSYHPVIWDGLKKITTVGPSSAVHDLIRSGIAVFCFLDTYGPGFGDRRSERRPGRDGRNS